MICLTSAKKSIGNKNFQLRSLISYAVLNSGCHYLKWILLGKVKDTHAQFTWLNWSKRFCNVTNGGDLGPLCIRRIEVWRYYWYYFLCVCNHSGKDGGNQHREFLGRNISFHVLYHYPEITNNSTLTTQIVKLNHLVHITSIFATAFKDTYLKKKRSIDFNCRKPMFSMDNLVYNSDHSTSQWFRSIVIRIWKIFPTVRINNDVGLQVSYHAKCLRSNLYFLLSLLSPFISTRLNLVTFIDSESQLWLIFNWNPEGKNLWATGLFYRCHYLGFI